MIRVKGGKHYKAAIKDRKHFVRQNINFELLDRAEEIEANDEMTVDVRFSSDQPVDMWFGTEKLLHGEDNIDLSVLNNGKSPVLQDHNAWRGDSQIGVITEASHDEHYGYASLKFSNGQKGTEYYNDVVRGIRSSVSVGYDVQEWTVEGADTDNPMYTATRWTPREVSFVTFPADDMAEVLRSRSDFIFNLNEEEDPMKGQRSKPEATPPETDELEGGEEQRSEPEAEPDKPEVTVDNDRDKGTDAANIIKLCEDLELDTQRGTQAITDGKSFTDFQREIIDELANAAPDGAGGIEPDESARYTGTDVDPKDIAEFRVLNLIEIEANPDGKVGGREREICMEEKDRLTRAGIVTGDYPIPGSIVGSQAQFRAKRIMEKYHAQRDLVSMLDNQGGFLVNENLLSDNFIDILYANYPVSGAASWITDVTGNLAIPKQNGRVVAEWTAETGEAPESTPTFELLQMSPKELRGLVTWSRTFALQSSIDAENIGRQGLMKQIGEFADAQLLYGTGAAGALSGITQIPAIKDNPYSQRKSYASGGVTYADCIEAIAQVGNANAMGPRAQFITSWGFWEQAMTTTRLDHNDVAVLDDNGMIAGFRAEATSQVKSVEGADNNSDHAFYGNWEYLIVPQWGGIDIEIDTSSLLHTGQVRVVAFMRIDAAVAHDEAFIQLRRTP